MAGILLKNSNGWIYHNQYWRFIDRKINHLVHWQKTHPPTIIIRTWDHMLIYELWHSERENSYFFIPRNESYEKSLQQNKQLTSDYQLIWTYSATSHFEAMQAYNDYLGYGPYKPEPDWQDITYE